MQGDFRLAQHLHDVEVVHLKAAGEGQHVEIPHWPLGFQCQKRPVSSLRVPEDPLTDHPWIGIEQPIYALQAQAGHADVVGIGEDQPDGQPAEC